MDVRKVQEIRWLIYCKSAICKSGQFEFDSGINCNDKHAAVV